VLLSVVMMLAISCVVLKLPLVNILYVTVMVFDL
jgi:hypothetical protein